jgi:hypothetical protein
LWAGLGPVGAPGVSVVVAVNWVMERSSWNGRLKAVSGTPSRITIRDGVPFVKRRTKGRPP